MRVLLWYCEKFAWTPAMKTLDDAPEAAPGDHKNAVVAFVHIEPKDIENGGSTETRLVKTIKWLARKNETNTVLLHSFTHLGEDKAEPGQAREILQRAQERLQKAGYEAFQTPWGHFLNLEMNAPGHPLARIFKEW